MKRILGLATVVLATTLAGCGDKSGGMAGSWTIDLAPMIAEQRKPLMEQVRGVVGELKAQLKGLDGEQLAAAKQAATERLPENLRGLVDALMGSEEVAMAAVDKMLAEQLGAISGSLDIKGDGTFTASFAMGGDRDEVAGTYKVEGGTIALTPDTKNGKPAEGKDKKVLKLTLKDGRLVPEDREIPFTFKRK